MRLSAIALAAFLIAGPAVMCANELDDKFQALKDAEAKKDLAQVKKLAGETSALAREELEIPVPQSAEDKEAWNKRMAYVREVDQYTEYALYSGAVQAPAAEAVDLLATLREQNPKSKYLDEGGYARYFQALEQSGGSAKVGGVAEQALKELPDCEDALMVLANAALAKGQTGPAVKYAQQLVSAASKHTKPAVLPQADFDRRRGAALGRGYFIIGMVNAQGNQYFEADRNLRAALPYIRGDNSMAGPALFALGVANYQLGVQTNNKARVQEAANFSDQASKIPGSHAQQAWANAQAMRTAAAKMR
jgi:hypothetical protein